MKKQKTASVDIIPKVLPGCSWWQTPFWQLASPTRLDIGEQARPRKIDCIFAGTVNEKWAYDACVVDISILLAVDRKAIARKYINENYRVTHLVDDFSSLLEDDGHVECSCGQQHSLKDLNALTGEPDSSHLAPSCQVFSNLRHRGGTSTKTGSVEEHPDYKDVMEGVPKYLGIRQPKTALVEESQDMLRKAKAYKDCANITYAYLFMQQCARQNYRAAMLDVEITDHGVWCEMRKPRRPYLYTYIKTKRRFSIYRKIKSDKYASTQF